MLTIPPLLGDIIRQGTAGRSPIDVVAMIETRTALAERRWVLRRELILIALHRGEYDAIAAELIEVLPDARVLAPSHDTGCLWLKSKHRRALIGQSMRDFIAAIRGYIDHAAGGV